MHQFYIGNREHGHRISAHRQTWFSSNTSDLSPTAKRQTEQNISNTDANPQSRWRDDYSAQRSNIAIYELIDAENIRARTITGAVDNGDLDLAKRLSKQDAPIKVINELLRQSNIPVEISVEANEQVIARKSGGAPYSIAELSDGERNALLVAAQVLTVKPGTLLLIDEPERHLHRSIISPLLTLLFERRGDCSFVVSTHDIMLPLDNTEAQTLLVRSCVFSGSTVQSWEADLLGHDVEIAEELKRDILGSRRGILFVEGTYESLDEPLYSLVFPEVSVVPKGGCREVEAAVTAVRVAASLHWVRPWGLVDNDARTTDEIEQLSKKGVYALPVFSVESIYYHPEILRRVAVRSASLTGGDPSQRVALAEQAVLTTVSPHVARLCARVVVRRIRDDIVRQYPTTNDVLVGLPIQIMVDVTAALTGERSILETALAQRDIIKIITRYPIRETAALNAVAKQLGFQGASQYESAVRKLLMDDARALSFVRELFGSLVTDIRSA